MGEDETHNIRVFAHRTDVLRYDSRYYRGRPARSDEGIELGQVVTHIQQCLARDDTRMPGQNLKLTDNSANFLPVGTPVYEVLGRSPDTHLGAYLGGKLHIYRVRTPGRQRLMRPP
jgi:hypothetical protein